MSDASHKTDRLRLTRIGPRRLRDIFYRPMFEVGEAATLGRAVMRLEAIWALDGRTAEEGAKRFVRVFTVCPWSHLPPP